MTAGIVLRKENSPKVHLHDLCVSNNTSKVKTSYLTDSHEISVKPRRKICRDIYQLRKPV